MIVTTSLARSVPQEEFKALGMCHGKLEGTSQLTYSGWVDENGNLNTAAFTPKSAAQGSATGIIAAFDPSIAGQ